MNAETLWRHTKPGDILWHSRSLMVQQIRVTMVYLEPGGVLHGSCASGFPVEGQVHFHQCQHGMSSQDLHLTEKEARLAHIELLRTVLASDGTEIHELDYIAAQRKNGRQCRPL